MASYLRPRRGKLATAKAQLTASAPLKRGEVFFEVPDTGVGTGTGKIKMGDGSTAYESLPYFMEQPVVDYDNAVVAWTNTTAADSSPYSTNSTYIGNIVPTANLKTIFTNLKKLLLNFNSQVTTLNNDLAKIILDKLYPIGSIYLETTNTNPSKKLGGTWVAYGASDTYLRLGGNGSGGSNSKSITLSTANLPAHSHGLNNHTHSIPSLSGSTSSNGGHNHTMQYKQAVNCDSDHNRWYICPSADKTTTDYMGWAGDHTHSVTTNASTTGGNSGNTTNTGSGTAFSVNVESKYVQVYAWKRTA